MEQKQIKAKLDVLMEMLEMIQSEMGGSVKSGMDELMQPKKMQEVSVMAPDEESLEEGLEMAKEILPEKDPSVDSMDDSAVASPEEPLVEKSEDEDSIFAKKKDKKKAFSFLED